MPLFHVWWNALKTEEYEICAQAKREIEYREVASTLCLFAVAILKNSDYPLMGMFDGTY